MENNKINSSSWDNLINKIAQNNRSNFVSSHNIANLFLDSLKQNYDDACGSGHLLMEIGESMPVIEPELSLYSTMFGNLLHQTYSKPEFLDENIFVGDCFDTNRNIHPEGCDVIICNPPFANTDQDLGDWLNLIIKKRNCITFQKYIDIFGICKNVKINDIACNNSSSSRYYEVQILMIQLLWCGHLARIMCTSLKLNLLYNLSPELYVYEKEFHEESKNIKIEFSDENSKEQIFHDHKNRSHLIITDIKSEIPHKYTNSEIPHKYINNDNILIAQIPNRIEKAYSLDKWQLKTIKNREEYKFSGVYFLIGEYEGSQAIYVGETHDFWDRITNHEKNFWDKVFLLTSRDKDEYWDKTQILYMESKFIYLYKKSNSYYHCINKNYSEKKLPESKIQTTEENFEYGKRLLKELGLKIPE